MTSFVAKVALITGASSGIGQAIAVEFAKRGAALALVDRNKDGLENTSELCKEVGLKDDKVIKISADIRNEDDIKHIAKETLGGLKTVDILVNNAGGTAPCTTVGLDLNEMDTQYNQSVRGPLYLTHLLLNHLIENKGNVINMSSVMGRSPFFEISYGPMKGAMDQMTKCMALELSPFKVRVNSICPGIINTPVIEKTKATFRSEQKGDLADLYEKAFKAGAEENPCKRAGTPEEVAKLAVFLASDDAAYITGTNVLIDGGWMLTSYFTTHAEAMMKNMMKQN